MVGRHAGARESWPLHLQLVLPFPTKQPHTVLLLTIPRVHVFMWTVAGRIRVGPVRREVPAQFTTDGIQGCRWCVDEDPRGHERSGQELHDRTMALGLAVLFFQLCHGLRMHADLRSVMCVTRSRGCIWHLEYESPPTWHCPHSATVMTHECVSSIYEI